MRVGLIADVHGNAPALRAVLAAAREFGVERWLCAGDCVGYYYGAAECLEMLSACDVTYVRGNHEDMLQQMVNDPAAAEDIHRRYGSGLAIAQRQLSPATLAMVLAWPTSREVRVGEVTFQLCHGAPWDTDQYVYPDAGVEMFERCASFGGDVVVMGHTHYPFVVEVGDTTLVNPGSVGQPRDRRPGASWAWFDTDTRRVHARLERYDVAPVVAEARHVDPHLPYLWEVLTRQ